MESSGNLSYNKGVKSDKNWVIEEESGIRILGTAIDIVQLHQPFDPLMRDHLSEFSIVVNVCHVSFVSFCFP